MAVDKDRLSSCTAGFGDLLSCVLATVYLALMALLSRLPLLMYSPASDWPRLARGPGDEPISDRVDMTAHDGTLSTLGEAPVQREESLRNTGRGLPWWRSGSDSTLPVQGAQV